MPELQLTRKKLCVEIKEFDEEEGIVKAILSSGLPDRQGEMIDQSSWNLDEYKKNPVVLWSHNALAPPIAQMTEIGINSDGMLEGTMKFAIKEYDFARTIFNLYAGKFVRAFSVGFVSGKFDIVNDIRILKDNILYEVSGVDIPADDLALAKSKGIDISSLEEKEYIEKPYPNEHACRLRDPKDFKADSFRRTSRTHDGKTYDVIMGRLKGETTMTEQAYRYPKDKWSVSEARSHCKEHKGIRFEPASEKDIDDIETKDIECCGLEEKIGRVLSAKNRTIIEKASTALKEVLSADTKGDKGSIIDKKYKFKKIANAAIRELLQAKKIK